MAYISAARHKTFLESLDNSIKQFEDLGPQKFASDKIIIELKKEKFLLESIYTECDAKTRQLKRLIIQYQNIERKARTELRTYRHICSKHQ